MRLSTLAITLALVTGSSPMAFAQAPSNPELAALRQQIAELQARLNELEERANAQQDINISSKEEYDRLAENLPKVETKGGLKVTSADKKFEISLGGRIHFDAYAFDRDIASVTGTSELRRARLSLQGKALGWDYKMEQDFAAGSNLDGLRDLYIARTLGPGKLTIGHFKPYRSMEELTSSNEILMMERPFASATGIYGGRQFQQGLGYLVSRPNYTIGASVFNLRNASSARNEGIGIATRATWAPVNDAERTVHLGLSYSHENSNQATPTLSAKANYAGRRGPSLSIASTPAGSGQQVEVIGLEAAAALGPVFVQGEYAHAQFGQPIGNSHKVDTWYVQGSWLINGTRKPYKTATGVFGSAAVSGSGQWELTARHDSIQHKSAHNLEASSTSFGVNYYATPNLRFMLNYILGDNDLSGDKTKQLALRTQFAF